MGLGIAHAIAQEKAGGKKRENLSAYFVVLSLSRYAK
jgi:hypothetical protein